MNNQDGQHFIAIYFHSETVSICMCILGGINRIELHDCPEESRNNERKISYQGAIRQVNFDRFVTGHEC